MMKAVAAMGVLAVLGGPLAALLSIGMLIVPAGECAPASMPTGADPADPAIPETTRIIMPLPSGSYWVSSEYGPRVDPVTGEDGFHSGTDFAAAEGTPILAAMDGVVVFAGATTGGGGNVVSVQSTVDGATVTADYLHIRDGGILVTAEEWVEAGQQIAEVGSTGKSTGPHLHFTIHLGGRYAETTDSLIWLIEHDAEGVEDYIPAGWCAA